MTDLATTEPKTDLTREYVAGGILRGVTAMRSTLPPYIDDIEREVADDTYERMLNDPQVAADVNTIRAGVIEDGATLAPAVTEEGADGYDQAAELVDVCSRMLADLTIPLPDVLWDMLDSIMLGNRVAEQVYEYDATLTGKTLLRLMALKPKPRRATAFEVDLFLNVLGLSVREGGRKVVVEREKFAILSFRPHNSDPRGTSIGRAAYNGWYLKQHSWPEYLKYLIQFASASVVGKTPPGAQDKPILGADGLPTGEMQTAEQEMLSKLLLFQNGTAIVVPAEGEVDLIFSSGEGQAFINAFTLFNDEIQRGIVHQTLALSEGQHQSRSAAETHTDVLDTIIRLIKQSVARMIEHDVLRSFVAYNYPPSYQRFIPIVQLGEAEAQDLPTLWTAAAGLKKSGYLANEQLPGVDAMLNLPPRQTSAPTATQDATPAPASDPGGNANA